ncbi:MAG: hypothetical protein ACJAXS_000972 [Colwellia sp.]|jgi:hypothetical protein
MLCRFDIEGLIAFIKKDVFEAQVNFVIAENISVELIRIKVLN